MKLVQLLGMVYDMPSLKLTEIAPKNRPGPKFQKEVPLKPPFSRGENEGVLGFSVVADVVF